MTLIRQVSNHECYHPTGSFQGDTLNIMKDWASKPHLVSAEWLIESMQQKKLVDESPYVCVHEKVEEEAATTKNKARGK